MEVDFSNCSHNWGSRDSPGEPKSAMLLRFSEFSEQGELEEALLYSEDRISSTLHSDFFTLKQGKIGRGLWARICSGLAIVATDEVAAGPP